LLSELGRGEAEAISLALEKCADKVKEECQANMRGSLYGSKDAPTKDEKCVGCGKKATIYLYTGRQY
jgi:hypothetical protein